MLIQLYLNTYVNTIVFKHCPTLACTVYLTVELDTTMSSTYVEISVFL